MKRYLKATIENNKCPNATCPACGDKTSNYSATEWTDEGMNHIMWCENRICETIFYYPAINMENPVIRTK